MIEALNSIGISSMMITSTVITIVIAVVCITAGRHMSMVPTGLQNAVEIGIEKLHGFFLELMGERIGKKYFPLVATFFIYILMCNYSGLLPLAGILPGLQPPTSSINYPMGLAIIVFIAIQVIGIREHQGLRFYKHFFKPFAFLFPLMILEELVRPVSLTLRLYGNIFGEEQVIHSFFEMIPLGLPVIMMALSVLMGLIQALVFALLAGVYITEAAETEEEHL